MACAFNLYTGSQYITSIRQHLLVMFGPARLISTFLSLDYFSHFSFRRSLCPSLCFVSTVCAFVHSCICSFFPFIRSFSFYCQQPLYFSIHCVMCSPTYAIVLSCAGHYCCAVFSLLFFFHMFYALAIACLLHSFYLCQASLMPPSSSACQPASENTRKCVFRLMAM